MSETFRDYVVPRTPGNRVRQDGTAFAPVECWDAQGRSSSHHEASHIAI